MSNASNDDEEYTDMQVFIDYLRAGLTAANLPKEVIDDFICLRAHLTHPWGVMHVIVNDIPSIAIVRPGEEIGSMKICYVIPKGVKLTDLYGNVMDADFLLPMNPPQADKPAN
jgi:hypothetical protein